MGANFIDYITTDLTTSTPEMTEHFDEYYIALPYSYMMSDHRCAACVLMNCGFSPPVRPSRFCRNLRKEVLDPVAIANVTRQKCVLAAFQNRHVADNGFAATAFRTTT
jgi:hypothetical protein